MKPKKPRSRARRVARGAGYTFAALFVVAIALFWGVHHFPWLGPALADGLRAVIGPRAVARLEDWAYAIDDRWQRFHRTGEAPQTYWQVPEDDAPTPTQDAGEPDASPAFRPSDVGPMAFHATGDGKWIAVATQGEGGKPLAYKTLIHPDSARAWAELFVVAIDLSRIHLRAVAGSVDPEASTPEGRAAQRPAVVAPEDRAALVAGFNGGWKAEHGHFGMKVGGVTLLPPRDASCTDCGAR